jgi:hypothetical protein
MSDCPCVYFLCLEIETGRRTENEYLVNEEVCLSDFQRNSGINDWSRSTHKIREICLFLILCWEMFYQSLPTVASCVRNCYSSSAIHWYLLFLCLLLCVWITDGLFTRSCRCGSFYSFWEEDVNEGEFSSSQNNPKTFICSCDSCSLSIRVNLETWCFELLLGLSDDLTVKTRRSQRYSLSRWWSHMDTLFRGCICHPSFSLFRLLLSRAASVAAELQMLLLKVELLQEKGSLVMLNILTHPFSSYSFLSKEEKLSRHPSIGKNKGKGYWEVYQWHKEKWKSQPKNTFLLI